MSNACDKFTRKGGCDSDILGATYGGVSECEDTCLDYKGCAGFMYNKDYASCEFVTFSEYDECRLRSRPDTDYYNCMSRQVGCGCDEDDPEYPDCCFSIYTSLSMMTAMITLLTMFN